MHHYYIIPANDTALSEKLRNKMSNAQRNMRSRMNKHNRVLEMLSWY